MRLEEQKRQNYVIQRFVQILNQRSPNQFQFRKAKSSNASLEDGIIYDSQSDEEVSIEVSEIRLKDESELCGNYDNVALQIEKNLPQFFSNYEIEITPPDFEDFCRENDDDTWEDENFPYTGFFSTNREERTKSRNRFVDDVSKTLISIDERKLAESFAEYSSALIWFGFSDGELCAVLGNDNPFSIRNSFAVLIHKNGRKGVRIRECPKDRDIVTFIELAKEALTKKMEKAASGGFLLLFAGDIWTLPAFTEAKLQIVNELKESTKDQSKFRGIWYWHNWVDAGDKTPNLHRIF